MGKNIINKVAETAIASQVESVENVEVDLNSQASQLATGKVESLEINCEKVIAFQDISLEEINVSFEIQFQFCHNGDLVKFMGGQYLENPSISLQETIAILNKVRDLIYFRSWKTKDLTADITTIAVASGRLILGLETCLQQLPDSIDLSIKSLASDI